MQSPQALSEGDRRLVAAWAADCAERVLAIFEAERPDDMRPRNSIERARAFARGELDTGEEIRRRFGEGSTAPDARSAAAIAAARAAGQAMAVCHMGAHALGAAGYAAKAAGLGSPADPDAEKREILWQHGRMTAEVRAILATFPPIGENRSGPLGPGLLSSGRVGANIRELQALLAASPAGS